MTKPTTAQAASGYATAGAIEEAQTTLKAWRDASA